MKTLIAIICAIFILIPSSVALAKPDFRSAKDKVRLIVRQIDVNGDKTVTKAEWTKAFNESFAVLDADNNRFIAYADITEHINAQRQQRKNPRLNLVDADRDGQISLAEFTNMQMSSPANKAKSKRQHKKTQAIESSVMLLARFVHRMDAAHANHNRDAQHSPKQIFMVLDRNHNNSLDAQELHGLRTAKYVTALDSNTDSQISAQEWLAPAHRVFMLMDKNSDGKLTVRELKKAAKKMRGKFAAQQHHRRYRG